MTWKQYVYSAFLPLFRPIFFREKINLVKTGVFCFSFFEKNDLSFFFFFTPSPVFIPINNKKLAIYFLNRKECFFLHNLWKHWPKSNFESRMKDKKRLQNNKPLIWQNWILIVLKYFKLVISSLNFLLKNDIYHTYLSFAIFPRFNKGDPDKTNHWI